MNVLADLEKERELIESHAFVFEKMGFSMTEAKEMASNMVVKAKEESLNDGTANFPADFGDYLLRVESTDINAKKMLEKKRMEGATNEDVRWWYNMHYLERRMMIEFDDFMRFSFWNNLVNNYGLSKDEAMDELRKTHAMFGDPEDTTHTAGEDRPLPFELKERVNIFLEKTAISPPSDVEKYRKEFRESSSFNAFVRKQIKIGNL